MYNASERILLNVIVKIEKEVSEMNTCFLLTHVPNPRMNKRIAVFKEKGDVRVVCSRRKSQNIWEPTHKDIKHVIFDIDLPSSAHIFKRFLVSKKFQKLAVQQLHLYAPNTIYAASLDSLLIAKKYLKKRKATLIYEVADLREAYISKPRNLIKRLILWGVQMLEKRCFAYVNYLVVTSPKFFDAYYKKLISRKNVLFIPNAPDAEVFASYKKKDVGKFTVGFIGGIRYLEQMKLLVDAAEVVGCDVVFAGAGGTSSDYNDIKAYCEGKTWVTFSGKYDYNKEIAKLYGMVDCVYAVYDADNPNVRIALPNKLYESVLCELPIIVAKGTYLADVVGKWGVGVAVSHRNVNELVDVLNKMKEKEAYYGVFVERCSDVKKVGGITDEKDFFESVC